MSNDLKLDFCLDLLRRLPPKDILTNFNELLLISKEIKEDLLMSVDLPLKVLKCKESQREFLCNEFNKQEIDDNDFYR